MNCEGEANNKESICGKNASVNAFYPQPGQPPVQLRTLRSIVAASKLYLDSSAYGFLFLFPLPFLLTDESVSLRKFSYLTIAHSHSYSLPNHS